MNKWEKAIREKVFAHAGLTQGEWVYLVGLFCLANDDPGGLPKAVERTEAENQKLRAALRPFAMKHRVGAGLLPADYSRASECFPAEPVVIEKEDT